MAVTGIIQRRSNKVNLISDPPVTGEIVFALDTGEHGWLDETSTLVWKKLDGESLPNGGTTGQVLSKTSNNDGDADWADAASGGGESLVTKHFYELGTGQAYEDRTYVDSSDIKMRIYIPTVVNYDEVGIYFEGYFNYLNGDPMDDNYQTHFIFDVIYNPYEGNTTEEIVIPAGSEVSVNNTTNSWTFDIIAHNIYSTNNVTGKFTLAALDNTAVDWANITITYIDEGPQ